MPPASSGAFDDSVRGQLTGLLNAAGASCTWQPDLLNPNRPILQAALGLDPEALCRLFAGDTTSAHIMLACLILMEANSVQSRYTRDYPDVTEAAGRTLARWFMAPVLPE